MTALRNPDRHIVSNPEPIAAIGGHARIAECWGGRNGRILALDEAENAEIISGDRYLLVYDLRFEASRASRAQTQITRSGASVLFIGIEPGFVQLGPEVKPDQAGCIDCLANRVRSNHPSRKALAADPADDAAQGPAPNAPQPQRPLLPSTMDSILDLLSSFGSGESDDIADRFGPGYYYRIRVDSFELARHRFIPVTHCPSCGTAVVEKEPDALRFSPRVKRDPSDKRLPNSQLSLEAARRTFVGRYSGLIKHVFQNTQSDLMPLFTSERAFPGGNAIDYNHGRAANYRTSELVAILEGVERYAGNELRDGLRAVRGSYAQMVAIHGDKVVNPENFILHVEQQYHSPDYKLERYTPELECGWVWGHSVRRGRPVLVPEQLAFYNIKSRPGVPANRFVYDSSNGCSLGGSIEEATLGGLHEVVERDAYFATWYSRLPPVRIDIDSVEDRRSAALIARSQASGFAVHLFDMTSDVGIPVVGAMIVDPSDDARVKSYCASASDGRWSEAIFSALAEVTTSMGVYRKNRDLAYDRARAMLEDHDLVRDMYDHVLLYCLPETYRRLEFLLQGEMRSLQACRERVPDSMRIDLTEELRQSLDRVLDVAHDVVIVDQTFNELRELGLSAVKVLVPGLMPVTFGHQYRRIDVDRLERFARHKGVARPGYDLSNVNPYPHNFP